MRAPIALLAACLLMAQAGSVPPDDLIARGRASFDAGRYADAVKDLTAAADAIASPAQMQQYVSSGNFEGLSKFETAVIYLALSYARLGRDAEARDQIQRLVAAEAITPTYATLPLDANVAGFEDLVKRLSPATPLPSNRVAAMSAAPPPPAAQPAPTLAAADLLARGRASFDAGRYDDAVKDLSAAANAIASPAQMQQYVRGGNFEGLPKFETAVIYLALSYARLGRDAEARDQIQRLLAAEAIAPTYATLPLDADVAGFEDLVKRLSPSTTLPSNRVAAMSAVPTPPSPQPAPTPAVAVAPPPAPVQPAIAQATPAVVPVPAPAPVAPVVAQATTTLTAEQQRELDQRIANARSEFQKELDQRLAALRADLEKESERRIAAERAAVQRETEQQIAAIHTAAAQEVSHAAAPTVRRAEGLAIAGDVEEANAMYARLLATPNPSRDLISAVATGFYRTGDYSGVLRAFQKLGTFARGEEDLRYYKAVSLYETGRYSEAKKELECALPFIEMTDEVNRYREKIEQMP